MKVINICSVKNNLYKKIHQNMSFCFISVSQFTPSVETMLNQTPVISQITMVILNLTNRI